MPGEPLRDALTTEQAPRIPQNPLYYGNRKWPGKDDIRQRYFSALWIQALRGLAFLPGLAGGCKIGRKLLSRACIRVIVA